MTTDSRVSIDLTDNDELKAYLKGKQPGDDYCIMVKGKIVENSDEQFVGDVDTVVEQDDDESSEDPAEEASETPAEEAAEEQGESDDTGAPSGMGAVVAKAMGKK